jgi:hypothetical protein
VWTRAFVVESTPPGVIDRRAVPFFAVISSHRTCCSYGLKPAEGWQQERAVPAQILFKSTSWLADMAQRSRGQKHSRQKRANVQKNRDRADLEKALAQAKKENAALLKNNKLTIKENKVLAAEREFLSRAVNDKGQTKVVQLMNSVINSTRREMAPKQEQYEKESKRLQMKRSALLKSDR